MCNPEWLEEDLKNLKNMSPRMLEMRAKMYGLSKEDFLRQAEAELSEKLQKVRKGH